MPDGHKRILSHFTGRKKRKAWNKTREKCMLVKRRQNLVETDRGSEEWGMIGRGMVRRILDSKGAFYNDNESDNDENNERQQLPEAFANSCYKIVSSVLLHKLINDFAACKHYSGTLLLVEDVSHRFGN